MRKLIITGNINDTWYAEWTIPYMRQYARRIGADFHEIRTWDFRHHFGDRPAWFHSAAIEFLASQSYYEFALILDADQLVMPHCPDIFPFAENLVGVVRDMGSPEVGASFRRWCLEHHDEQPADGCYFNAGLLVVPQPAAVRISSLLTGSHATGPLFENHYLNLLLCKHESLAWLPQEFNWLAPQFTEAALKKHIVHFVGRTKKLIPDFVRRIEQTSRTDLFTTQN